MKKPPPQGPHQYGDAPIEDAYHAQMVAIVQALDQIFNGQVGGPGRKTGFILMVFPLKSHEGRCNYISNGVSREDVVVMLKEQVKRFEGQPELEGRA